MHHETRQRVDDLLRRAGLTGVKGSVVKAAAVLVACAVGFAFLRAGASPPVDFVSSAPDTPAVAASEEASDSPSAVVVVHVAGAVVSPGVYELRAGARVDDAIRAAGGALGSGALQALNLARILADGEQVYLPTTDEVAEGKTGPGVTISGGGGSSAGGLIDLNTATVAELDALPGIGPSTAQKIVDDRTANGPFGTVDDLVRVSGIGTAKVGSLRDLVTVK